MICNHFGMQIGVFDRKKWDILDCVEGNSRKRLLGSNCSDRNTIIVQVTRELALECKIPSKKDSLLYHCKQKFSFIRMCICCRNVGTNPTQTPSQKFPVVRDALYTCINNLYSPFNIARRTLIGFQYTLGPMAPMCMRALVWQMCNTTHACIRV